MAHLLLYLWRSQLNITKQLKQRQKLRRLLFHQPYNNDSYTTQVIRFLASNCTSEKIYHNKENSRCLYTSIDSNLPCFYMKGKVSQKILSKRNASFQQCRSLVSRHRHTPATTCGASKSDARYKVDAVEILVQLLAEANPMKIRGKTSLKFYWPLSPFVVGFAFPDPNRNFDELVVHLKLFHCLFDVETVDVGCCFCSYYRWKGVSKNVTWITNWSRCGRQNGFQRSLSRFEC